MSDTLTVEQRGPVRIVTMDDGKANAFSLEVINDLRGLLREAEADDEDEEGGEMNFDEYVST